MSGNKRLVEDLILLRALVNVGDACLREGLPFPDAWRKLVADLAGLVHEAKTKEG